MSIRLRVSTASLAAFCCFLVVGILGVYLKSGMLHPQWGALARFLGMDERWELGPLDRLGFYRNDLLVGVLLFPLTATSLVTAFRRYRVIVAATFCALISVVLFYESKAQFDVGRYVSRGFLVDSIQFAVANPETAKAYISPVDALKLAILLVTFALIWFVARVARQRESENAPRTLSRLPRLLLVLPIVATSFLALPIILLSFAHYTPGLSVDASALYRVGYVLLGPTTTHEAAKLDFDQALAAMHKLTNAPRIDASNPLVGTERGANVLIFVMETGPAKALDLVKLRHALPGASQLFEHAFVAQFHYTTYPYTGNAVYSIYTGMYPQGRERLLHHSQHRVINGFMSAVSDAIPFQRIYMPSLGTSGTTLKALVPPSAGVRGVYISDEQPRSPLRTPAEQRANVFIQRLQQSGSKFDDAVRDELQKKLTMDFQALAELKVDIAAAVRGHRRFAFGFFPQIGHAPWLALQDEPSILERGHHLMQLQDRWLAEVVDTLRQQGQLDNTVIVFTADHGIRTRKEDPALPVGKISDYMFRVPLLIYAPKALQHTKFINVPSSHIDVAPTLLALLGNATAALQMEGVPLWQRSAEDRLYFWAGAYGGADGFEESGRYFMRQEISNATFGSGYAGFREGFPDNTFIGPHDPDYEATRHALEQAETLQETIVSRLITSGPGN